jgi:hypothetical protein
VYASCGIHSLIWEKQAALTAEDVTPEMAASLRKAIASTLRFRGKKRFVNKDTNNCMRIAFLKAIFPDAQFIHILRDGRAVAHSLKNVDWWPDLKLWWSGFTPREWQEKTGRQPIELCGLHWRREVQEILSAAATLEPESYLEVRYEALSADPIAQMKEIVAFCGLPWTASYEAALKKFHVENRDVKWMERLSEAEKAILHDTIGDMLAALSYPVHTADAHSVSL